MAFNNYHIKISSPVSEEIFIKGLKRNHPGEQFWGCIDKSDGKLIAYASNLLQDNMCNYYSLKAIPEYLKNYYPYYGLLYAMNEYYLNNLGLRYVSDGSRSISNHSNIQQFLMEKFKFRKAYCKISIQYKQWLKILISLLFPFRKFFTNLKLKALFHQEAMARNLD
jgi:hypothetical protein